MVKKAVRYLAGACLAVAVPCAVNAQDADPLASLPPAKHAFLTNAEQMATFGLTPDKVRAAVAGRTPAEVEAYADALATALEDAKYKPGVDYAEIALNPQARSWNAATVVRPAFLDERQRDPGLIDLRRYMFQRAGVPTFADAPIAVRIEDLIAGKAEVAFMGVPLDTSSGWRDAKNGPGQLRNMGGLTGVDAETGIDPTLALTLADYGNLTIDQMAPERGLNHVQEMVAEVAKAGVKPFIVGGDHTINYPNVAGVVDAYGKGNVTLVQFNAHPDAKLHGDHFVSDNQTMTRLLANGILPGKDVVHVGMRGPNADPATQKRLTDAGVTIFPTSAVRDKGWKDVTETIIASLANAPQNVFLSFDMSVLDPGDAPASGRPVPGGILTREAIPMVREICARTNVVGFDLLDPAPVLDLTYVSRMSANTIMHACLSGIAARKQQSAG